MRINFYPSWSIQVFGLMRSDRLKVRFFFCTVRPVLITTIPRIVQNQFTRVLSVSLCVSCLSSIKIPGAINNAGWWMHRCRWSGWRVQISVEKNREIRTERSNCRRCHQTKWPVMCFKVGLYRTGFLTLK